MIAKPAEVVTSGSWGEEVTWEFCLADQLPPRELCTAVFCLAIHGGDGVVLTKTKRGWEMLGGHVEDGETVEEALLREAHEEGGFTPDEYRFFGYRKITSTRPILSRDNKPYPYPVSYIPYFIARGSQPLESHHGDVGEVIASAKIAISQLHKLRISDVDIIRAGLQFL